MAADPLDAFPAFVAAVRARLEHGRLTFGETGFAREPGELVGEIREELLDVCGWAFILATRVDALGAALGEQAGERPPADAAPPGEHAPAPRSVHLPGFTPETLALLYDLAEQLRMPPGQVVAVALRALVVTLEQKVARPRKTRRLPAVPPALPPKETP